MVALRQASETGQLFGSVSPRDIADMIEADGVKVGRSQVVLNAPIKMIGSYKVPIALHPEVEIAITVNVARSADEAERLARGEDITVRRDQSEAEARAEAAKKTAEAMFDPEAKSGEEEPGSEETGTAEAEAEAKPAKPKKAKAAKAEAKAERRRLAIPLSARRRAFARPALPVAQLLRLGRRCGGAGGGSAGWLSAAGTDAGGRGLSSPPSPARALPRQAWLPGLALIFLCRSGVRPCATPRGRSPGRAAASIALR